MNRAVQIARLAAYGSLSLLLSVLAIATLRITPVARQSVLKFNTLLDSSQKTVDRVNLTLKEADYVILKAGLTADSAKKASDAELASLVIWNRQITTTLADVDASVKTANGSVADMSAASVDTLRHVNASVDALQPAIAQTTAMLKAANEVLADPNVKKTLASTAQASANISASTANLDATTADVRQAVHGYLHPTWLHRIWSGITGVGIDVGRILF